MTTPSPARVILVTGANSGIGAALANFLAGRGYRIAVAGRRLGPCEEVADLIRSRHGAGTAAAFEIDVARPEDWSAAIPAILDRFGRIDVLINNAGIGSAHRIMDVTPEEWAQVWGSSVTGSFFGAKAVYPIFRAQGYGHVINIASQAAGWPGADEIAYGTAKTAQVKLTLHLLDEFSVWNRALEKDGRYPAHLFAHAVCPGAIYTPLWEKLGRKASARVRFLEPDDIPDLCAELIGNPRLTRPEIESLEKPYRTGPIGVMEPHPNVIRIWRD